MTARSVVDIMNQLLTDWAVPRLPRYLQEAKLGIEMPERCCAEKSKGPLAFDEPIPDDLREFWGAFSSSNLFEDVNYGQWGLEIFDYETSSQRTRELSLERPEDVARGDRVIGRFIGDLDLLVIRCDPRESDFGDVIVALGDGERKEWYRTASSLSSFLEEYASYDGQKYWETQFRGRKASSGPPTWNRAGARTRRLNARLCGPSRFPVEALKRRWRCADAIEFGS